MYIYTYVFGGINHCLVHLGPVYASGCTSLCYAPAALLRRPRFEAGKGTEESAHAFCLLASKSAAIYRHLIGNSHIYDYIGRHSFSHHDVSLTMACGKKCKVLKTRVCIYIHIYIHIYNTYDRRRNIV